MPLLDHFHSPLKEQRHWESFHAAWCTALADDLNSRLPPDYFAEEHTHAGPGVEIDVPTWQAAHEPVNGTASAAPVAVWAPPAPALTVPLVFADDFEVRVIAQQSGLRLVAAIELVSPRNKERPEARSAFAIKCASYLHEGVGLIVVDIVTDRHADLHQQIMTLVGAPEAVAGPLYASAYRPLRRGDRSEVEVWAQRLTLGATLPTLPLALTAELLLPIDLETSYLDVCRRRRIVHLQPE